MPSRLGSRVRRPAPVSESLQGIGNRLRAARLEAGLSQAQVGAPHFTRAYVSAIELGKVRPAMKSLEFIAARVGKPVSFFVLDEVEEARRKEREVEIVSAAALLNRSSAGQALAKVEALLETSSSASERLRLHLMAGTALNFAVRGADALKHLTEAQKLGLTLRDSTADRTIRYQTALAHRHAGNSARTRELLRALNEELDQSTTPDRVLEMKVLKDLGAVALDMGEPDSAEAYYNAALVWANEIGDISGLASIYNGMALAHRALGDLDAATGYLQKALGASEVSNDLVHVTVIHNTLAIIAADRGHGESAMRHADRAIEVATVAAPSTYLAHCLATKAECAVKGRDWETARTVANQAMVVAERTSNSRAAAAARVVLADIEIAGGRNADGERELREAAGIYEALQARSELGNVLMRLSRAAQDRGDRGAAQELAERAYQATRRVGYLVER